MKDDPGPNGRGHHPADKEHTSMRKAILTLTILIGVLLGALPARAATFEFHDPTGDATGVGVFVPGAPSDDQFDITRVALTSTARTFTYAAAIKKLASGTPSNSTGYYFRLAFDYEGGRYWFVVIEATDGGTEFGLLNREEPSPAVALTCIQCTGVIDREANAVIVTVPISSLAAAMKQDNPDSRPVKAGSGIDHLYVLSQRYVGPVSLTADEARAPDGVVFKL